MGKPATLMVESESSAKEYLKFTAVILGVIAASVLLTILAGERTLSACARWFMGVFFVVFASFKFVGYRMFVEMFQSYDTVAARFNPYAYAYPFIELALGLLYLANLAPSMRDWLTLIIMGVGSIGVVREIRRRSGIHCACLGNVIKLPLSTVSLVEDAGMGLMALALIFLH